MADDRIIIDNSHVSKNFLQGNEGTHAIAQQIKVGDKSIISYTDVNADGSVGESGFDGKK